MSESEKVEAHVPITLTIDVDALLRSELGWTQFNAGGYEDPELDYAPGGVMDKEMSDQLSTAAKKIKDHAKNIVAAKLAAVLGADL